MQNQLAQEIKGITKILYKIIVQVSSSRCSAVLMRGESERCSRSKEWKMTAKEAQNTHTEPHGILCKLSGFLMHNTRHTPYNTWGRLTQHHLHATLIN